MTIDIEIGPILREAGATQIPTGSGWRKMLCPFHTDKNPSAAVNHTLNGFICHSCGMSGDAIKLIRVHWGKTYHGAVEFAQELGAATGEREQQVRKSRRLY